MPSPTANGHPRTHITAPTALLMLRAAPPDTRDALLAHLDGVPLDDPATLGLAVARFGLGGGEADVLRLALAPERDPRARAAIALAGGDARGLPTVELAARATSHDAAGQRQALGLLAEGAPLLALGLVRLDAPYDGAPRALHTLHPDARLVAALLGAARDAGLGGVVVRALAAAADAPHDLPPLAHGALLLLTGPDAATRAAAAEAVLAPLSDAAAWVDGAVFDPADLPALSIDVALRALAVVISLPDASDAPAWLSGALTGLRRWAVAVLVLAQDGAPLHPVRRLGVQHVALGWPPASARADLWARALPHLPEEDAATLGARYTLTAGQVHAAATLAAQHAFATGERLGLQQASAAARAVSTPDMGTLAQVSPPRATWDDLVLPPEAHAQLLALVDRAHLRAAAVEHWGDRVPPGVTALFAGPSGTGKTLAAEVVAGALGLPLARVDLAGLVSKYIGETEKNLAAVFRAAAANAVLFFDEADALFGRRSEVRDAHDRYANLEVSYLLQQMEAYPGVALLATNLRAHLDTAFTRRLAFVVHFPLPDAPLRHALWQRAFPDAMPLADGLDLAWAASFPLAGGHIRSAALAAAFLAAAENSAVAMAHLVVAVAREYGKLGRALTPAECAPYADLLTVADATPRSQRA